MPKAFEEPELVAHVEALAADNKAGELNFLVSV